MKKIREITDWIENNSTEIIENIDQESVDVYNFLKTEFRKSNINENYLFQFVFRSFYRIDNAGLTPEFKKELYQACRTIIEHEDAFIDLAFQMGPMEGLTGKEVKDYIRFIANRRLTQLGLEAIYDIDKNPLTWLDDMLNGVEHMNFFEGRATEYSKASTQGSWVEAFS